MVHGSKKPNIGCDGTFSIGFEDVSDRVEYELNTIVSKYIRTGKPFSVLRACHV